MHQFTNLHHLLQISFLTFLIGRVIKNARILKCLFLRPLKSLILKTIYLTKIFCKLLIRNWSPTFNVPLLLIGFAGHRRMISMFSLSVSKCIHVKNYKITKKLLQSTQIDLLPTPYPLEEKFSVHEKSPTFVIVYQICIGSHFAIFIRPLSNETFKLHSDPNLMNFNA